MLARTSHGKRYRAIAPYRREETDMKPFLERLLSAAVALALVASLGAILGSVPTSVRADDKPKDCKMYPQDPRCKDDQKK